MEGGCLVEAAWVLICASTLLYGNAQLNKFSAILCHVD